MTKESRAGHSGLTERPILNELHGFRLRVAVTSGTLEVRSSTSIFVYSTSIFVYHYDTQRRIPENLATGMTAGNQII
jgi:hypothetical protein